jgi:hypothetical protein
MGVQRRPARAHLVIVVVVRHMRLPLLPRSGSGDYRKRQRRNRRPVYHVEAVSSTVEFLQ